MTTKTIASLASLRVCGAGLLTVLCLANGSAAPAATLEWDGGGDGVSTYAEANWVVTDSTGQPTWTVGSAPPNNTVNPNQFIAADMIVGGTATAGGPAGAGPSFSIGDGFTLTVEDDAVFRMGDFNSAAIVNFQALGVTASVTVQNNGRVLAQFLREITTSLLDSSELTLYGANPIGQNTTIDMSIAWDGSIIFRNANPGAVAGFLPGRFSVGGVQAVSGSDPAVIEAGDNVTIVSNGGSGSILRLVPEPTSAATVFLGLACASLLRRRS